MQEGSQTLPPPTGRPDLLRLEKCTLIIVEIGFCKDLGCDIKFEKKTEKYSPLPAALRKY